MSEVEKFRREAWGIERVLFRIRRPIDEENLVQVFTARDRELERAIIAIGDAPANLLVNGVFGVGKTVFVQMLLHELKAQYGEDVLCVSECLDNVDADLATTILRGVSRALKTEDPEAKDFDDLLTGVELSSQVADKDGGSAKLNLGFFEAGGSGETSATESRTRKVVPNAAYQVRQLLERAHSRRPGRRLVVAVDDLDKRDPNTVRANLLAARSTLHNHPCSFVFTGHPLGILRDAYSSLGGIFDDRIELGPLPPESMREMMLKYLDAGRSPGASLEQIGLHPFTEDSAQKIIERSFGLPRVLNVNCYHILSEAAISRLPKIGLTELQQCWQAAGDRLKQATRADVRGLLEVISEQTEGLDPLSAPDDVVDRLGEIFGVNTLEAIVHKLNELLQSPEGMLVGIERGGRSLFLSNPLLPPSSNDSTEQKS